MMRGPEIARWLLLALALFGVLGVAPISYEQFVGQFACPHVGPIPACHVVLAGYSLVLIAALVAGKNAPWFFWIGWLPVFSLAASGTSLELVGVETCPRSGGDIPTCYYSLAMSIAVVLLFLLSRRRQSR